MIKTPSSNDRRTFVYIVLTILLIGAVNHYRSSRAKEDESRHEYVVVTVKHDGYVSAHGFGTSRSEIPDWNTCLNFYGTRSECNNFANMFVDPHAENKAWPDTFRCYLAEESICRNQMFLP